MFGRNEVYTQGAIENAQMYRNLFPDWKCYFYVSRSVPKWVVKTLADFSNVVIHDMSHERDDWSATLWRFYAVSHAPVTVMISRDCDSRPSYREKLAVEEWLASDKQFHIMRDHPYHNTEILAGMWGVKTDFFREMATLVTQYSKGDFYQVDQNFLRELVYPKARQSLMVHDEFFDYEPDGFDDKRPFPIARYPKNFVGQGHNADNSLRLPADAELV